MTEPHPELAAEQAYISRAYAMLDRGLADAEKGFEEVNAQHRATAQALRRAWDTMQNARGSGQLVFGRVDTGGDTFYIGRRRVYTEDKDLMVIGWYTPVGQLYYEATAQDPHEVELKRVFTEKDRILLRLVDEIARTSTGEWSGTAPGHLSDALLEELDRSRDGAMRDVVRTIQAEQYRIIRTEVDGTLVVQGGPGTGKTVVGLHRAAWLALNHEELRHGILVVTPTTALLGYVGGVLPSLDVSEVHQTTLESLYAGEARAVATDTSRAGSVKGSARTARLLARALRLRTGWDSSDLELSIGSDRIVIPADQIKELVAATQARSLSHREARDLLRQSLTGLVLRTYADHQRELNRPAIATETTIRRLSAFTNALDRMWPSFTPEDVLRSLYSTQSWLAEAAEGILSPDERAQLYRPAQPTLSLEPWTVDDLFCLDELAHLIDGDTLTYAHVVVDEAQDLSPMQARALARRCPTGSFTLLGDLAQATGTWIRDDWRELTEHLTTGAVRIETLSTGYRVPAQILDLAARQLPHIAPGLAAPASVRQGPQDPVACRTPPEGLIAHAVALARSRTDAGRTTAVIAPDARYEQLLAEAARTGHPYGDGSEGDFSQPLTLLRASLAKGLEFDSVVLVAPDEIAVSGNGRRVLYVAMTRSTQELHLVHCAALPTGLEDLAPPPITAEIPLPDLTGPDLGHEPAPGPTRRRPRPRPRSHDDDVTRVASMLADLSTADLLLVEELVLRLRAIPEGGHVAL